MSLFEHLMKLNELQVNGEQIGEDDDFDMGDNDQTADDTPDPNTNPSDTANAEAENQQEDNPPPEDTNVETADDEDDFTLDDDGEEAMDNTTTDDAGNDGGDTETPDDNADTAQQNDGGDATPDDTGADTGDDDFSMDDGGDSGDGGDATGGEGGENAETDGNNDSGSGDNNTPSDPTDGVSDEEQRAAEEEMYDSLTDDQKRIRTLQLKIDYKDLYETFINALDGVSNIPKTSDNLETIKRLNTLLTKAKSILISYIRNNFDQNTYLENYTMYLKYLAVFRTAAKVIEELNNTDDKKSKKK